MGSLSVRPGNRLPSTAPRATVVGTAIPMTSSGIGSTSRSLLERLRADETDAWDRLVELYAPLVLYWCRRSPLNDQDAADVFQEVFQTVATRIQDFRKREQGDSFRGWLRTITRSKIVDHHRRGKRQPRGVGGSSVQRRWNEVEAHEPQEDSADDRVVMSDLLRSALERIREHFRETTWRAFWGTAIDGRPHRDVAEELGLSPGAARVAKSRVLQRLRAELGELTDEPAS